MPALGKAKEKAKQIVCKSNLKGIGLCVNLYLNEYDNRTPQTFGGYYDWTDPDTGLVIEIDGPGYANTYWGAAFKDYAENNKIFSCPSFSQFKVDLRDIYYKYKIDENTIVGGFGINTHFEDTKVTQIRTPSEYIIAQDHVEPKPEIGTYDLFYIDGDNEWNLPAYRETDRSHQYSAIFRHSKKNYALDHPDDPEVRFANINDNPNGQSDTLRLDGSVSSMRETNGKNVRKSWYTGK